MATLLELHLRIQQLSKEYAFIPNHIIIKEFKGDVAILGQIEELICMGYIDPAIYHIGEIRLTESGRLTNLPK